MIFNEGDAPVAYARRWFDRVAAYAYHDLLIVVPEYQGQKIGCRVLANSLELYKGLGITQIGITAGLDAGGYVWARFGYRPVDAAEWAKVQRAVAGRLARSNLSGAMHQLVEAILKNPDPRSIWVLADLRDEATSERVGQAMLKGLRWHGTLNLLDPLAVARLRSYIERCAKV